jgi:hypothetical protein
MLATEPQPANLDIKPLTGHVLWLRLRRGEYRILYRPLTNSELRAIAASEQTGFLVERVNLEVAFSCARSALLNYSRLFAVLQDNLAPGSDRLYYAVFKGFAVVLRSEITCSPHTRNGCKRLSLGCGPCCGPRVRGMARVVVDGRYSYETDLELEVGDEVLLPPSGLGGQWVARVTALSSDYAGPCRRILGLVRRRIDAERQDAALSAVPITGFRAETTFEVTASCGHQVLLHIEGVNRTGRPTHVRYTCQACGGIPHTAGLGSAAAWRRIAAGLD